MTHTLSPTHEETPVTHNIAPALADRAHPIDDLHPHPKNARRRDDRARAELRASLEANGQYRTVIARRIKRGRGSRLQLLAGHGTVEEARGLGWTHVAVDVHEGVSDESAARIVLADNRTSDLAGYDDGLLAELLSSLPDLEGTGYVAEELSALVAAVQNLGGAVALTDPDEAPPAPAVPRTRPNDVWLLGPHRLVCGDATDEAAWAALLGDGELIDCVWTDPPYGVAYKGKTAEALTIRGDGKGNHDRTAEMLRGAFTNAVAHCKPGAPWYVTAPAGPARLPFSLVLTELRLWRQTLIWLKDAFVLGKSEYHYRHEDIYFGYSPSDVYMGRFNNTTSGTGWYGGNARDSVIEVQRPRRNDLHPTMKPVDLIVKLLEDVTVPGQLVADMFAGSGSTLIACHHTGRVARLVEDDPPYADVICRRWQEHTGIVPIRESDGAAVDFTRDQAA